MTGIKPVKLPKPKPRGEREAYIEDAVSRYAATRGMLVYKFSSPNRRSVPDREFIPANGVAFFIEFKARGRKPTEAQSREIQRLVDHNVKVYVVDDIDTGKRIIDEHATP